MAAALRLLLLDEPAAGLNGEEQRQLAGIVRSIRDSHFLRAGVRHWTLMAATGWSTNIVLIRQPVGF